MAGIPISAFLDNVIASGPQFLSGTDNIVNNVSARSFLLGKFLRDKPASRILMGSNKIRETLYLIPKRTFRMFNRGQSVNFSNLQKDINVEYDMRFGLDEIVWDEYEYKSQSDGLTGSRLVTKYKDMAASKQQGTWDSVIQGMEDQLVLPPNGAAKFAAMESGTGSPNLMYSLPVFVHENASNSGGFDSNWTTVGQVNQSTHGTYWDNQRVTYDATDPADNNDNDTGLFNAFDEISIDIGFEALPMKPKYGEADTSYGEPAWVARDHCIPCSKAGKKLLMSLHRKSNDNLMSPQDAAYPMPLWNGIPIKDVAALDAAALYAGDSSTFVAEEAATVTNSGPRFYFLNTKYLIVAFHEDKYFQMLAKKDPLDKIGQYVIPVEVWCNMICTGRRWQGIVSPA